MTTPKAKPAKTNPLRRLHEWLLRECEKPYSFWFLNAFSFLESIIVPLPTDPLLLAKATAEPKKALKVSIWVALSSVVGGVAGYFLAYSLWEVFSPFIFAYIFPIEIFEQVKSHFEESVFLFVVLGGFTPLPFKAFALTAGSMQLAFAPFLAGCLVGRGLRFITLGLLVFFFGPQIQSFIDRWLEWIFIVLGGLVLLIFLWKIGIF